MKALIIANGSLPAKAIVTRFVRQAEYIVCADGGANHARRLRVLPDIILGDLDSITPSTKRHFRRIPLLRIADQESTDLEKALTFCVERRFTRADILAATGDRIDHSTGTLGCFKKFGRKIPMRLIDQAGIIQLVGASLELHLRTGDQVSLIPLERCTGITTKNLKYALSNESLELGVREGISNVATAPDIAIRCRKGILLCMTFHRR
jgi:thiamine pyrophosphokinase